MRRLAAVGGALALGVLVTAAPVSLARFSASTTTGGVVTTDTIAPPTGLGASAAAGVVTLTWTPTVSTFATGYDVLRSTTSGSGFSVVSSVTPRTAVTTTNSPGTGTFYYVLQSAYQGWRSASSNQASATAGSTSTGYKNCASTLADTGGDGNGYESLPGNACVQDGSLATDASSGTNTSTSCTDAGKDRHRFWGYGFGLPATVTSVDGITVQLRAALNAITGTTVMCAQLSWDGGTSWTATKSITPTTTLTTFTLGSTSDTWGRTWTAPELGSTQFRIRVIDASSVSTRSFKLDWVGAQVSYTP